MVVAEALRPLWPSLSEAHQLALVEATPCCSLANSVWLIANRLKYQCLNTTRRFETGGVRSTAERLRNRVR